MSNFEDQISIDASIDQAWEALSRIGNIGQWNPGVKAARLLSEQAEGVGAARSCDLGGRNYVHEAVATWDPPHRLTMRIVDTNLPFQEADIHFTLRDLDGTTQVSVAPEYRLKYGPVGSLLDKLFVRRVYRRSMRGLLEGLKGHVEAPAELTETG